MDIRLYNSLSRSVEAFAPQEAGKVTMYQCGPTVYDTSHIGNYRTFVMDDIIRRVFEWNAYSVDQAMNITDVDDKTIKRSAAEKIPLKELTLKYEKLFLEGLASLNILLPHHVIRATEYIQSMIELIQTLLDREIAYKAEDGIYLSIGKVNNYGELAKLSPASLSRERIANDEYDKDDPHDFALWKFKTAPDGDVAWDAPFGAGRPGWHIECSAMAMKTFGPTVDIHTGGTDLLFPHHTNEIAQSESATGKTFARYWIHGAFMNVNEEKMAKSRKNFLKLEDLTAESISPIAYRYWLLTAHYRSPVNFSFDAVKAAQNALIRLMATVRDYPEGGTPLSASVEAFTAAINNDFDMPRAVALTWELIKDESVSEADKRATLLKFDTIFGLGLGSIPQGQEESIPTEIIALSEAREEARSAKDWKKADALRMEMEERGYTVKDTSAGPKILKQ